MSILGLSASDLSNDEMKEDSDSIEETIEYEDDRVRADISAPPAVPATVDLFASPDAHPVALSLVLLRKYGPEWLDWEPEVLEVRIGLDLCKAGIHDLTIEKIQAIKCLHLADTFWRAWTVFAPCSLALSGSPPDFGVIQALTVPQLVLAVDTANMIRTDVQFSEEVLKYMHACHIHEGVLCPIYPLDTLIDIDGAPYGVDTEHVRRLWSAVKLKNLAPSEEFDLESEQLRRMLTTHQILVDSRAQLQSQIKALTNV